MNEITAMIWQMIERTDEDGRLIVHGWALPDETCQNMSFFKCYMNRNMEDSVAAEAGELADALALIDMYYEETETKFGSFPTFCPDDEEYDFDVEEAFETFNSFLLDHGVTTAEQFDAIADKLFYSKGEEPDIWAMAIHLLFEEFKNVAGDDFPRPEFINLYVFGQLYAFKQCVYIDSIDVSEDKYDEETESIGMFDKSDLCAVIDMLEDDCSIMCTPAAGYMLLVNEIFSEARVDLMNEYVEIEKEVREILDTFSPRERRVIISRYGLEDGKRHTYYEIARDMNEPSALIRSVGARAIRRLRHPSASQRLKRFIEADVKRA